MTSEPILTWNKPMTSQQARRHWMTNGFVAVELWRKLRAQRDKLLRACKKYRKLDNDRRAGCDITDFDWAECYQAASDAIAECDK